MYTYLCLKKYIVRIYISTDCKQTPSGPDLTRRPKMIFSSDNLLISPASVIQTLNSPKELKQNGC